MFWVTEVCISHKRICFHKYNGCLDRCWKVLFLLDIRHWYFNMSIKGIFRINGSKTEVGRSITLNENHSDLRSLLCLAYTLTSWSYLYFTKRRGSRDVYAHAETYPDYTRRYSVYSCSLIHQRPEFNRRLVPKYQLPIKY